MSCSNTHSRKHILFWFLHLGILLCLNQGTATPTFTTKIHRQNGPWVLIGCSFLHEHAARSQRIPRSSEWRRAPFQKFQRAIFIVWVVCNRRHTKKYYSSHRWAFWASPKATKATSFRTQHHHTAVSSAIPGYITYLLHRFWQEHLETSISRCIHTWTITGFYSYQSTLSQKWKMSFQIFFSIIITI